MDLHFEYKATLDKIYPGKYHRNVIDIPVSADILHLGYKLGDVEVFKLLMELNVDFDSVLKYGARMGCLDIVEKALEKGATDYKGGKLKAMASERDDIVRFIDMYEIDKGHHILELEENDLLMLAIDTGDIESVRMYARHGAAINMDTARQAIIEGRADILEFIIFGCGVQVFGNDIEADIYYYYADFEIMRICATHRIPTLSTLWTIGKKSVIDIINLLIYLTATMKYAFLEETIQLKIE